MCIFQSEQLIKLINALVLLENNEWPPKVTEFASSNPLDYNMLGATLGPCQNFTPKPSNTAQPCYGYGMICHKSSLIRQSCHFKRHLIFVCCCSWWTFEHSIHFKYRDGSWHSSLKRLNCWKKFLQNLFVILKIQDATACSLEKVNFNV